MSFVVILCCIFSFGPRASLSQQAEVQEEIQQGIAHYQMAETAGSVAQARLGFNEALTKFQKVSGAHSSSSLAFNTGNCFFQLGEYPWAILHYEKAKRLSPRNPEIASHLKLARQRAGLPPIHAKGTLQALRPTDWISLSEQVVLGSLLVVFGALLLSLWIWFSYRWCKHLALVLLVMSGLALVTATAGGYFAYPDAVTVESAMLRCSGGEQYAAVQPSPIIAGSLVTVVGKSTDGQWLEVRSSGGNCGFIPLHALRLVSG